MISRLRLLFWLGVIMLFLPFLGISDAAKTILAVLIGISLINLSLSLRKKYRLLRLHMKNLEQTAVEQTIHE